MFHIRARRGAGAFRLLMFLLGFFLMIIIGFALMLMIMPRERRERITGGLFTARPAPLRPSATDLHQSPDHSTPSRPEATPMPTPPPVPQERLDAAYRFSMVPALDHPPAELILLPDRNPLTLLAETTQTAVLPENFRETARSIRWNATAGTVTATPDRPGTASQAAYLPPAGSERVRIEAGLEIELASDLHGGRTARVRKSAALEVLAPIANTALVNGLIHDYPIGRYPDPGSAADLKKYHVSSAWPERYPLKFSVPAFFYKVEPDSKNLLISPNIPLGFFTIDFPWKSLGMPQYIALDFNLVRKLEDLRTLMRENGINVTRFVPIYGFRPPAFNLTAIEEHPDTNLKEPFSMHQFGRAADFIIDEDGDGMLDDLNGDGRHDVNDAVVIMHFVNLLDRRYREQKRMEMVGGAGLYALNDFVERNAFFNGKSSPYVHMDTRGFVRDNGTLVRWPDNWPGTGEPIPWGKI